MKRSLVFALVLGLCSFGVQLFAQQDQQRPGDAGAAQQQPSQQQTDAEKGQSAQSFQGKIAKSGNQLVFQDSATQTAYQIDDQSKVAPYEGKNVKLMATIDSKTNTLHVVDVTPAEK